MTWLWVGIALVAVVIALGLHLFWRRRCRALERDLAEARTLLRQARAASEIASAEARAQRQDLFDGLTQGVILLDAGRRIQLVNRALIRFLHPINEPVGRDIAEAFPLPGLIEMIQRVTAAAPVATGEMELPGPPVRSVEVNVAAIIDAGGQPREFVVLFHELTRVRQLEETRRDFVANVSHELRTPLSLIKGYVETLLNGAKDDPATATRFLEKIARHADRLADLIDDILIISRLEAGQVELRLVRVELHGLVGRILEEFGERAGTSGVVLENAIPPSPVAWADLDRVHQVLVNLVENALKYGGSKGSRVTVSAFEQADSWLKVVVTDHGPGIPREAQERIFERFYRLDRARSRESGGTGLGLSIVKHIVQSHGGQVWVESEPGAGARFCFTLPAAEKL